jgi:epoxyqueuosine reductase
MADPSLFEQLQRRAQALGLHQVAVLPGDVCLDGTGLRQWLQDGHHADMDWMTRNMEKRLQPGLLMPGTQSIVCATMVYRPRGFSAQHPARLKVARYALGLDYHQVFKQRLGQLLAEIKTWLPGTTAGRALVDSAPVLEKALAVRAGLGWQGKHSNVIHPRYGSWFFLGQLLLSTPYAAFGIAPEAAPTPLPDLCGRCRRCIDACPTEAIVAPGQVDARRCLSFWTIESKAVELPVPIAQHQAGWVFGCDICQEVCPWNLKFAASTDDPAFSPHPALLNLSPTAVAGWTQDTFAAMFAKSPLKRTGWRGFRRNVASMLGNAGASDTE